MKILFLCTVHNSLSQRLYCALAEEHTISIELAISDAVMIEAVTLFEPNVVLCPFLTVAVPKEIYQNRLTLIVHPGPPGDAGPSSLDWLLMGDDGSEPDHEKLLETQSFSECGRTHWAVSIIQATEVFDAGPVWAFEQFEVYIDEPELTKSNLYRGVFSRAAVIAVQSAIGKAQSKANLLYPFQESSTAVPVALEWRTCSVTTREPFEGGITRSRPLLRAADRGFDIAQESAKQISRKIRSADSQPGCLSPLFGPKLYLYGGIIDETMYKLEGEPGSIIAYRNGAICVLTKDCRGLWITHLRQVKRKEDKHMWPKVPAALCLGNLGIWNFRDLTSSITNDAEHFLVTQFAVGFHDIRVHLSTAEGRRLAYVYFEFYNGAMSTDHCTRLLRVFNRILETNKLHTMVLMGGEDFFCNGIHLSVIEADINPALETWNNINRMNDVVFFILHELPRRGIRSVAVLRGNCAAGGVALAAACDYIFAGSDVVLNPSYRAIGLHGSEYHTLSYRGRCGATKAASLLQDMLPLSAEQAQSIRLINHVLHEDDPTKFLSIVRRYIATLPADLSTWKTDKDLTLTTLQTTQANELAEMAKDCWSARADRFNSRRKMFVCKIKPMSTPLRFATHRRNQGGTRILDEEEMDRFDDILYYEFLRTAVDEVSFRRAALQNFMSDVQGVYSHVNHNGTPFEEIEKDDPQLQLTFPCHYRS